MTEMSDILVTTSDDGSRWVQEEDYQALFKAATRAEELADKYRDQVRDTCARAEKAEAALSPTPEPVGVVEGMRERAIQAARDHMRSDGFSGGFDAEGLADAILGLIPQAVATEGWRPIREAPFDPEWSVLGWEPGMDAAVEMAWRDNLGRWLTRGGGEINPTMFMPLPAAPAQAEGGE